MQIDSSSAPKRVERSAEKLTLFMDDAAMTKDLIA